MEAKYDGHNKSSSQVTHALALLASLASLCVTVTAIFCVTKQGR